MWKVHSIESNSPSASVEQDLYGIHTTLIHNIWKVHSIDSNSLSAYAD